MSIVNESEQDRSGLSVVLPGKLSIPVEDNLSPALDMPDHEAVLVELGDPTGPFGAKSVGESGLFLQAAAIANAIYDAVGVRMREVPMTPEKVLAALKTKG